MSESFATELSWSGAPETFRIDLNAVRDEDYVVALVGFRGAQRVPAVNEPAVALDHDGYAYSATVAAVLPDHRVYLRLAWETRRHVGMSVPTVTYEGDEWVLVEQVTHSAGF